MRRRWAFAGVVATLGGIGFLVLDVRSIPIVSGESLPIFLGWSALVSGVLLLRARLFFVPRVHASLDDVEHGVRVPVPGDGFDTLLTEDWNSDYSGSGRRTEREYVRSILRDVVVTTLELDGDYTRDESERSVESGSWTDDRLVASFLSEDRTRLPLAARVRAGTRREPLREQVVRRTITELERIRSDRS